MNETLHKKKRAELLWRDSETIYLLMTNPSVTRFAVFEKIVLTPDSPDLATVREQIPLQASQNLISWSYEPVTRTTDILRQLQSMINEGSRKRCSFQYEYFTNYLIGFLSSAVFPCTAALDSCYTLHFAPRVSLRKVAHVCTRSSLSRSTNSLL